MKGHGSSWIRLRTAVRPGTAFGSQASRLSGDPSGRSCPGGGRVATSAPAAGHSESTCTGSGRFPVRLRGSRDFGFPLGVVCSDVERIADERSIYERSIYECTFFAGNVLEPRAVDACGAEDRLS